MVLLPRRNACAEAATVFIDNSYIPLPARLTEQEFRMSIRTLEDGMVTGIVQSGVLKLPQKVKAWDTAISQSNLKWQICRSSEKPLILLKVVIMLL